MENRITHTHIHTPLAAHLEVYLTKKVGGCRQRMASESVLSNACEWRKQSVEKRKATSPLALKMGEQATSQEMQVASRS